MPGMHHRDNKLQQSSRPTQSMIVVHCRIAIFQQNVLLMSQNKYEKSFPKDRILQDLIPCTRLSGTGRVIQNG